MLLVIFLSGCTTLGPTQYQPESFTGGYSEFQINRSSWRVIFNANGFSAASMTEEFAIRRAAELCLQNNYSFFFIQAISNSINGGKPQSIVTVTFTNDETLDVVLFNAETYLSQFDV